MNHTIRLPIDSHNPNLTPARVSIIAASETQVYLLVVTNSISIWTGHPLIPSSWKELCRPSSRHPTLQSAICALSSDGLSLCFGFTLPAREPDGRNRDIFYECYDVMTGQWTKIRNFGDVHVNCVTVAHTSLGWLAVHCIVDSTIHLLYTITQEGELVTLKIFKTNQKILLGYNHLYVYSQHPLKILVYPLSTITPYPPDEEDTITPFPPHEDLTNPQQFVHQGRLATLCDSNGQLYSVEHGAHFSFLHKVQIDGGLESVENPVQLVWEQQLEELLQIDAKVNRAVFKLQRGLLRSRLPVEKCFHKSSRLSTIDSNNFYSVSLMRKNVGVWLSTQSYKPASLRSVAFLGVQKMFGMRHVSLNPILSCLLGEDSVRDVWEGGITTDEFRKRFGYKRKLF